MSAYVGTDFVCGLPFESVIENCEYLSDSFDVEEKCLVWNYAGDVFGIVESVCD